jgi:hypothetical protein
LGGGANSHNQRGSGLRQQMPARREGDLVLALSPNDECLPGGSLLSPEEKALTAPIVLELLAQLDAIRSAMPLWMTDFLDQLYSRIKRPLYGHQLPSIQYGTLSDSTNDSSLLTFPPQRTNSWSSMLAGGLIGAVLCYPNTSAYRFLGPSVARG